MGQRSDSQSGDAIRILFAAAVALAVYCGGAAMGWWPWAGSDDPPPQGARLPFELFQE